VKLSMIVLFATTIAIGQESGNVTIGNGEAVLPFPPQHGTLRRAELLTPQEKAELLKVQDAVLKAEEAQRQTKAKIAAAHKMSQESYMEWASWYEFDGDFILSRYESRQTNNIGW